MNEVVLGFDYGRRKIGVAVGRVSTGYAEGITKIPAIPAQSLWFNVDQLITNWQPDTLVVGLPMTPGKNETEFLRYVRHFGKELTSRYRLPVNFVDETLTTDFADAIIRETTQHGKRIHSRRKSMRDQLAAELILTTYLNEFNSPKPR